MHSIRIGMRTFLVIFWEWFFFLDIRNEKAFYVSGKFFYSENWIQSRQFLRENDAAYEFEFTWPKYSFIVRRILHKFRMCKHYVGERYEGASLYFPFHIFFISSFAIIFSFSISWIYLTKKRPRESKEFSPLADIWSLLNFKARRTHISGFISVLYCISASLSTSVIS